MEKTTDPTRVFVVDKIKIYFGYDFLAGDRKITYCVVELPPHQVYSGVAIPHPKELFNRDIRVGWKIALQRACKAMSNSMLGYETYKWLWHNIRKQLRTEQVANKIKTGIENLEKAIEEKKKEVEHVEQTGS